MDSRLTLEAVEALVAERRRQAETYRLARSARGRRGRSVMTIRMASSDDGPALARLAELDSATPSTGPTLVAVEGGEVLAALQLDGGKPMADPFRRTADAVRLLEIRAGQLEGGRRHGLRRLLPGRLHPRAAER